MAFDYNVIHTPGVKLVLADALSRAPLGYGADISSLDSAMVEDVLNGMPISTRRLERIKATMVDDVVASELIKCICFGWPTPKEVDQLLIPYYTFRD